MPTALVIGGGVAGPVAAMALHKAGIETVVAEARPPGTGIDGLFLTLEVNGVDALRAVDADHVVRELGFATPWIRLRSGTGKVLGRVSTGAPLADGTTAVTLRRADLYAALRDEAARRGIPVTEGRRLVGATSSGSGVRAEFADGTTETADVLVGADGVRSTVRQLIDPEAAAPRPLPLLDLGGFAPAQPTDAEPGQYEMVFGRRGFFGYAVAPDGGVWWFANPRSPAGTDRAALSATTPDQWRARLVDMVADDRSPAAAIIASTPGDLTAWRTQDLPSVRHWHRDRMVVIGDAAHAMSPSAGQGASMAVEDAVELARCLRDLPAHAAFRAYERSRRARVEKVVAQGARTSSSKAAGPVGRAVRDAMLPLVLRATASAGAWKHRHHIDWDEPVPASAGRALSSG
jgi:2-polyprenyl-6-methoxyphenol hydroxylase-like FAD-dependent oxidoreductase